MKILNKFLLFVAVAGLFSGCMDSDARVASYNLSKQAQAMKLKLMGGTLEVIRI